MANQERARVQLLVDDLMRDDIVQGQGALRRVLKSGVIEDCCLARACEVFRLNSGVQCEWVPVSSDDKGQPALSFIVEGRQDNWNMSSTKLPIVVQRWFGFDEPNPHIGIEDGDIGEPFMTAISANDDHHLSFKEIAEGFKKHYIDQGEHDNG